MLHPRIRIRCGGVWTDPVQPDNARLLDSNRALTERSLRIAREIDHERGVQSALVMLGDHHRAAGKTAQAEDRRSGEQLVWSIADDGVGRDRTTEASPKSSGKTALGTAIARNRLALLQQRYGTPAGFRYEEPVQGTHVVVRMPLITA